MGGHYFYAKTFTAGKTKSTAEQLEMILVPGIVHNVIIAFPAGAQRLTNVRILRGVTSVFPRNQGAYYKYDNFKLPISDFWPLSPGEKSLILEGYNTDDTHNHEILIALQVTEPEIFFSQLGLLDRMDTLIKQQLAILGGV